MRFYLCQDIIVTGLSSFGENDLTLWIERVDGPQDALTGRFPALVRCQYLLTRV